MTPEDFLKTLYLGDRACKGVAVDSWQKIIRLSIDCISRVRGDAWDFYADEDIEDGYIVFLGAERLFMEPAGLMPNDWIELPTVTADTYGYIFTIAAGCMDSQGDEHAMEIRIHARAIALENPKFPGKWITD